MLVTMQANPISDLMFDWLTVLQAKAAGVYAYENYIDDAEREEAHECAELFAKLRDQDVQQVQQIKDHLVRLMNQRKAR